MSDPRRTGRPRFGWSENPRWQPDSERQGRSRLLRAMSSWGVDSLEALQDRAIADPEWYWCAVVQDLDVEFSRDFTAVCDDSLGKQFSSWFVGRLDSSAATMQPAVTSRPAWARSARWFTRETTANPGPSPYTELDASSDFFAANLVGELGVRKGDRVVIFMPSSARGRGRLPRLCVHRCRLGTGLHGLRE